ncbi:MAG TPA: NAD(P)-dependent alcohol dehydrogenase [Burkholderiaceae bacterium]|nr:NAD(P)-dependent alcohol dehydrogenase [Burkholderiaceae bacterium]
MKAHVCRRYGGPEVIELADVPKPVPADDDVLVRIRATTVTAADWRVRTLEVPRGFGLFARLALGITGPRQPILGTELAGTVEAVGKGVTRYRAGDAVFAFSGVRMGCHAEYRVVPQSGPIAKKPEALSFEEAAALPFGGHAALHFLRQAKLKAGERILVVGASGSVGTAMVQLAKHRGAEVTGVTSTRNLELVVSLGAHRVIDYTKQDYAAGGQTWDVIADTVGAISSADGQKALSNGGRFLAIAGDLSALLAALRAKIAGSNRVIAGPAEERVADFHHLVELAAGGVLRPVIDTVYPFAQMREAHRYVETRRKRGSVVVSLSETSQ